MTAIADDCLEPIILNDSQQFERHIPHRALEFPSVLHSRHWEQEFRNRQVLPITEVTPGSPRIVKHHAPRRLGPNFRLSVVQHSQTREYKDICFTNYTLKDKKEILKGVSPS